MKNLTTENTKEALILIDKKGVTLWKQENLCGWQS